MRAHFLVSFLLLVFLNASPVKAANDWEFTKEWVGKYPSDPVAAGKSGLLSQPAIGAALKKILPKPELSKLSGLTTESVVKNIDGLVVINKCRPHNCPTDMAMVVIDAKAQKIWVGFFTREASRVSTRWYGGEDDYAVLPDSVRKEFLSRHGD
jgi:hypothetical protein